MKSLKRYGLLAIIFPFIISTITYAGVIKCNSVNLRIQPVGFKCDTIDGNFEQVFERVYFPNFGEAWKDPKGVIWSSRMSYWAEEDSYKIRQDGALETCKLIGAELPTDSDVWHAEDARFRQVLLYMNDSYEHLFWTSSGDLEMKNGKATFPYRIFSSRDGQSTVDPLRNEIDDVHEFVCIFRTK